MKNNRRLLTFAMIVFILVAAIPVSAADKNELTVYNTHPVTSDVEATYIAGEVADAHGQTIYIKDGFKTIAQKEMPNTNDKASFNIKVPVENIDKENLNIYHVQDSSVRGLFKKNVRVELGYIEREKQDIKTNDTEYKLTFPGNTKSIKADATSGENLTFSSSDTKVATVDSKGTIVPVGAGEAEISIKQSGSSTYEKTGKTVKVKVEAIDAFTITYHSSANTDETKRQIIEIDSGDSLQANPFENESHTFLGWARSDDGLVEYRDGESIGNIADAGENVDMYAVWTGDGARAAIAWAVDIANNDSFSYGKKPATSKIGCYFCGTNQKRKPKGYEKTYVCITFIHAAYAHGAEDPQLLRECHEGSAVIAVNNSNFSRYSCWEKVGLTKNLTVDDLEPGDVISFYNAQGYTNGHMVMYIGDNKIVDAAGIKDCWGPNSIAVRDNAAGQLRAATRWNSNSYVMRYIEP